jgi:glycosyltransferase involved in cell wall biosynthesis
VRVSVIVPVRNRAAGLRALLDALAAQTLRDHEVVIVDDASTDATAAVAEAAGARVVRAPRRGGAYVARNLGLDAAHAEVLAFTDADCRPEPDWLERGLAALEGADLVAGHVELPLRERPSTAELIDAARHLHQERNAAYGFGATANLFARRSAFERAGRFDESLSTGGDLEFGLRSRVAGLRLVYAADAVVEHEPRRTGREVARKAARLGRGRAALAAAGLDRPPVWTHPGAWFPNALLRGRPVYGIERLEAAGRAPQGVGRLKLAAAEWAIIQIPMVLGDLAGSLAARRAG